MQGTDVIAHCRHRLIFGMFLAVAKAKVNTLRLDGVRRFVSQYSGVTRKGIHALALQVSDIPLTAVAVRMSVPSNHVSAWISRAVRKLRNDESFLSSLHEN